MGKTVVNSIHQKRPSARSRAVQSASQRGLRRQTIVRSGSNNVYALTRPEDVGPNFSR